MKDFYGFVAACTATEIKDTLRLAATNSSSISTLVQRLVPYTEYRVQMIALSKGKRNGSISMRTSSVVVLRTNEDGEEWLIFNSKRTWVGMNQRTLPLTVDLLLKKLRLGNTGQRLVKFYETYVIFLNKGEKCSLSHDYMILWSYGLAIERYIRKFTYCRVLSFKSVTYPFENCLERTLKTTLQTSCTRITVKDLTRETWTKTCTSQPVSP